MIKNKINDDIVIKAQMGDENAFSQIYYHYYKKIYFIAYEYFHDTELANDIVQETMLGVYKNIGSLSSPSAIHTWILSICHRRCIDETRKRKIKYYSDSEDENIIENLPSPEQNKNLISEKELKSIIAESLEKMSPPLKSVGLLRFHEELSIQEISEILEIPNGTVKSRIDKIKRQLQADLRKKEITPAIYASHTTLPALIVGAYIMMEKEKTGSIAMLKPMVLAKTAKKSTKIITLKVFMLIAGGLIIGGTTLSLFMNKSADEIIEKPVEETKIVDISYNEELTKDSINLFVKTNNDDYDEILINGVNDTRVSENGEYLVEILKNGKVIDKQKILINNIDKTSPELLSAFKDEYGKCTLMFLDENGIDYSKFEFYKNGKLNSDYVLNEDSNTITFKGNLNDIYYIKLKDIVGNSLNTKVYLQID